MTELILVERSRVSFAELPPRPLVLELALGSFEPCSLPGIYIDRSSSYVKCFQVKNYTAMGARPRPGKMIK